MGRIGVLSGEKVFIFPAYAGKKNAIVYHPTPRQKFAVKHYMATPPPLKGEGASISFQPAGSIAGVG